MERNTPPRQPQAKIDIGLRVQIKGTQDRRLNHTLAQRVPSGTPAGLEENLNPLDEIPPAQAGTNTPIQPRSGRSTAKKKTSKSKPSRKNIKAPDSETDDRGDLMSDDPLTKDYYKKELHTFLINDAVIRVLRPKIIGELQGLVSPPAAGSTKLSATKALMRLLKETGIIAESFEAEALFDLKFSEIKQSVQSLFELLAPLVGEPDQTQKLPTQSKSTTIRSTLTVARWTPIVAPGDQTAASSPCVSATEEVESSDSEEPPRMALGSAGAAMFQNRAKQTGRPTTINPRDTLESKVVSNRHPPEKLESFFQAAMERFLKEQQVTQARPKPRSTGDQDVEMESVGSPDQPTTAWEYDPGRSRSRPTGPSHRRYHNGHNNGHHEQSKTVYGSIKPRQKSPVAAAGTRVVRAVHVSEDSSDSDEESRSSSNEDLRRVYLASRSPQDKPQDQRIRYQTQESHQQDRHFSQYPRQTDEGTLSKRCSHCGSRKHDDLGCWRRLTCNKCGKRGHPSDRCLLVCRACGEIHEAGKFCIYAYVEKQSKAAVNKVIDNTCDLEKKSATAIADLHQTDEYSRSEVKMILDISSGESRGYWKYHVPDKKFKQAKAVGKINNAKATLLFDSGAEVSILDTAFARKVGWYVDNSQTLQCEGVGKSPYMAEGRTRLKTTLAGSLVYFFDAWVGPPTGGQDLILGMDFMVPAGIRLDLADGTICLPDEVQIQLAGRRPLYGDKVEQVTMGGYYEIDMGGSEEVRLRTKSSDRQKLWVTGGDRWVPTYVAGPGWSCYLRLTNVSERKLILHGDTKIAMWLTGDRVPRLTGYVSVGSRRYADWQNLAYQATTDKNGVTPKQEEVQGPDVERPLYQTPTSILKRPPTCPVGTAAARQIKDQGPGIDSLHSIQDSLYNVQGLPLPPGEAGCTQTTTSRVHGATNEAGICSAHVIQNQGQGASDPDWRQNTSASQWREQRVEEGSPNPDGLVDFSGEHKHIPADDATSTHSASVDLGDRAIDPGDEEVSIKESGDLYAEDVANPNDNTQEQVDQLKQTIWRRRHLLIGKGNSLPPAAKGAICDIDVGNAKPVSQRVRKVAPQCREKLFQLIKGLLSAKIIQHSTSAWASPIVVIIKKNGIDIRLCIDYRLVNSLTRLMVYPIPLINDLLDDLDKVLWYCSLDMASGFLVVSMTDRARAISAFITPFGLFEWNRMPFGLKNAPQICQRVLDNALSMQSFLGSLNYYSRFIEDCAIYASILYELREIDFFEASGQANARLESDDQDQRDKWTRATKAFVVLKEKIVNAPILTHFDPDKRPVVILYASKWAISAALVQEHEGVYKPVTFTSRTLKPNEINYGIVDKEVLALLRMLDVCYTQLVTRSITVLTRHSTLAWVLNSSGLQ
ncbi:unnamed protein product [Phytophthora fragariaefolia]|uniref:Unnamed protein product n=1 Tax=Phytophthora fragariaefolia TaxID=1490495 RepID=A0A9W6XXY4_9STRA|nr:unnamed protein product [Phytophthora fragariaefolia]